MKDRTYYEVWTVDGRGTPQHRANMDTRDEARTAAGYYRTLGGATSATIVEVSRTVLKNP